MRLLILGPVLATGVDPERLGGHRQVATLLALALHAPDPVPADRLAELVWANPPPSAPQTLRSYLSRLRDGLAGTEAQIVRERAGYRLTGPEELLDATEFERAVHPPLSRRAPQPTDLAALQQALALWRGPALEGFADSPFAPPVIARLDELRLRAVHRRAELGLAAGEDAAIVTLLQDALRRDPLDEASWALLVRALYRSDRQAEALAALRRARELLRRELGVSPGHVLAELERAVLAQDPDLDARPAPAPGAREPVGDRKLHELPIRSRLPEAISSFVGRKSELAMLAGLLVEHRLVTLVGPGGCGKTRLAVQAARNQPHQVLALQLGGCAGEQDVARALTASLGLPNGRLTDATERAARLIDARPVLLLVDDCERVVQPVAQLLADLLAACPQARALCTSRRPVRLCGERLAPLLGFADPAEAVALFRDRAALVAGPIPDADLDTVAGLCAQLENMPLSIELAAATLRTRSVSQIAELLDRRLDLLASTDRAGPGRHRTLRATLEWSHALLSDELRVTFRRLSVMVDPFDVATAAQILGAGNREVATHLQSLLDQSLLIGPPYRMLDTVRLFAREQLDADPAAGEIRTRHAEHFARIALEAAAGSRGGDAARQLARLEATRNDRRAGFDHLLASGKHATALELAGALLGFWEVRYYLAYGRNACRQVLALTPDAGRARLPALFTAARLALQDDDFAEAERLGNETRELADRTGDATFAALSRVLLGDLLRVHNGATDQLATLLGQADSHAAAAGDPRACAEVARLRLYVCWDHGELRQALAHGRRRIALLEAAGDRTGLAEAYWEVAGVTRDLGRLRIAEACYAVSQDWFEKIDDPLDTGVTVYARARLAVLRGDIAAARSLADRTHELALKVGDRWLEALSLRILGQVALAGDRFGDAERLLEQSLAILEERGFHDDMAATVHELGRAQLALGRLDEAERCCRQAIAGQQGPPPGRWLGPLTSLLGRVALARGDAETALQLCRRGAELTGRHSARYLQADAADALAAAERACLDEPADRSVRPAQPGTMLTSPGGRTTT